MCIFGQRSQAQCALSQIRALQDTLRNPRKPEIERQKDVLRYRTLIARVCWSVNCEEEAEWYKRAHGLAKEGIYPKPLYSTPELHDMSQKYGMRLKDYIHQWNGLCQLAYESQHGRRRLRGGGPAPNQDTVEKSLAWHRGRVPLPGVNNFSAEPPSVDQEYEEPDAVFNEETLRIFYAWAAQLDVDRLRACQECLQRWRGIVGTNNATQAHNPTARSFASPGDRIVSMERHPARRQAIPTVEPAMSNAVVPADSSSGQWLPGAAHGYNNPATSSGVYNNHPQVRSQGPADQQQLRRASEEMVQSLRQHVQFARDRHGNLYEVGVKSTMTPKEELLWREYEFHRAGQKLLKAFYDERLAVVERASLSGPSRAELQRRLRNGRQTPNGNQETSYMVFSAPYER